MSGGSPACAACKFQRRKCDPNCALAPFFPPDAYRNFVNAHRLFGVGNILKIISKLDLPHKELAMKTIIFESNIHAADPVGGCYRIICDLQSQIEFVNSELQNVLRRINYLREQFKHQMVAQLENNCNYMSMAVNSNHDRMGNECDSKQGFMLHESENIKPILSSFDGNKEMSESTRDEGMVDFIPVAEEQTHDFNDGVSMISLSEIDD